MYHIDEKEAAQLYEDGCSITEIATRLGTTHAVIRNRLVKQGIKLRTASEVQALNYAANLSLQKKFMEARRKYPLNELFFDTLTSDSAYIIGLIQADGNINLRHFRLCITLKPSDADFLSRLAQRMGADRPLINAKSPFGPGVYLGIYSHPLILALQQWGIQSPKSHTASTHPALLFNRDYWRGVIDGDGTLCVSAAGQKILALVGSQPICNEFLAFCQHHACGLGVTVRPHKQIFSVRLSGKEAVMVAGILYEGATLALDRKRTIYYERFLPTGEVV